MDRSNSCAELPNVILLPDKILAFDEVKLIIQSGNSELLEEEIKAGRIYVNMCDNETTQSLLMVACETGFTDCVIALINSGADGNYNYSQTINGLQDYKSVLISACLSGNIDMIETIIKMGFVISDDAILNVFKRSDIVLNTPVAAYLLRHVRDVNYKQQQGFLYFTCKAGNAMVVQLLFERGARCRPTCAYYQDPLITACRYNHISVVKVLLGWMRFDTPANKNHLSLALVRATAHGFLDIVEALIEHVADNINLDDAFGTAMLNEHLEVAELLLDNGACFGSGTDRSPFSLTCRRHSYDIVRLLIARGADPNGITREGSTPLREALFCTRTLMVLFEHGADPNKVLSDGSTLLLDATGAHYQIPASYNRADTLTLLLENGADPNLAHARTGWTALMVAVRYGYTDLVKLLLERGADVTQVNREGKSALDILGDPYDEEDNEIIRLCEQYMYSVCAPVLK